MKESDIIFRCPNCNKKITYSLKENKIIDIEKNKSADLNNILEVQKKREESLDIFNEMKNYSNKKELSEKKFFNALKEIKD